MLITMIAQVLRYAPSNVILRWLHTRRPLTNCCAALALGMLYLWAASILIVAISHGAAGWINLLVGLSIFNGIKFLAMSTISALGPVAAWLPRPQRGGSTLAGTHRPERVPVNIWANFIPPASDDSAHEYHLPGPSCLSDSRHISCQGALLSSDSSDYDRR